MKFNGLSNLGNTCFLNSCIQIILEIQDLNDFLDKNEYKKFLKNVPDSVILMEWNSLRNLMKENTNCVIAPEGFLKAVQTVARRKNVDIFTGYAQNDMPEFLTFFMNCLHTALSREVEMKIVGNEINRMDKLAKKGYQTMIDVYKNDYSEMISIFFSLSASTIFDKGSKENDYLSIKFDPMFMISLPIVGAATLYDCFNEYCKLEVLEGENQWYNEKTNKKQDALKQLSFWSLPNYLIIDLKRFDNRLRKIENHIKIPMKELDLSSYVCGYNPQSYKYDLFGVVKHMGNVLSGHYVSNVIDESGVWWELNDSNVRKMEVMEVINKNVYCLFYKKK